MKKKLAVLMDITLIFLLVLLSSNYPESLPRYNPKTYSSFTSKSIEKKGQDTQKNSPEYSGPISFQPIKAIFH